MESNPILQELHPGTQTKVLSLGSLEPGLETEYECRLSIPEPGTEMLRRLILQN